MVDLEAMDPRQVVFGNIFLLANRLQTVMDQTANGLTARQWFVITMLELFDQPPTLKQLAAACSCSHQNVKQLVLRLEAKGFLRIEPDPDDRRAMRILPTDSCRRWGEENNDLAVRFLEEMFRGLSLREIEGMKDTQQTLHTNLERMKEELQ